MSLDSRCRGLTSGHSGGIADRIDLDHRAVHVAARRHEGTFERPERVALAAHQFGQDLGDMARLARRNRYVWIIAPLL